MLELKTKRQLADEAFKLSRGHKLVRYRNVTYIPADFETRETSVPPDPTRTIWLPLTRDQIRLLAAAQFDTLFGSDSELSSFDFMVAQTAQHQDPLVTSLLVRTPAGLRELNVKGELVEPDGTFRPNTVVPMLNEEQSAKEKVFSVLVDWLDSEEEAVSLLRHLATALAPGWSAVKYVLLLGEGRNGKSTLLKMVTSLFGRENVSSVTRQAMSEQNPIVTELNGKLLNVVYDGLSAYLKDSGVEKSLIAGEPVPIRKLYESSATLVQSNALFLEGLNREPKTGDKSTALQKRLVRFQFPNVYALDHRFERSMLTEEMLGALLSLLIDHYVREDEVAEKLAPTAKAIELQLEQMYVNSIGLQFLKHVEESEPLGVQAILGCALGEVVQRFQSWRVKENDLATWSEPDVAQLLRPLLDTERKAVRINGKPRKVRVVTALKLEASAFIDTLRGEDDDAADLDAVVGA